MRIMIERVSINICVLALETHDVVLCKTNLLN